MRAAAVTRRSLAVTPSAPTPTVVCGSGLLTLQLQANYTALHYAARSGRADCLAALIDAGSNLEAKDKVSGTPPRSHHNGLTSSQTRQTALTCAVRSGKLPCVTLLLDRGAFAQARSLRARLSPLSRRRSAPPGANVEASAVAGWTSLHYACSEGAEPVTTLLLRRGASMDARTQPDGLTPLHLAASGSRLECARALLLAGAPPDAAAADGRGALHLCAARGRLFSAKMLLEHGARVDMRCALGRSPLHCAAEEGQHELTSLLLSHGRRRHPARLRRARGPAGAGGFAALARRGPGGCG